VAQNTLAEQVKDARMTLEGKFSAHDRECDKIADELLQEANWHQDRAKQLRVMAQRTRLLKLSVRVKISRDQARSK
jgi:hypothetical protein